MAGVQTDLSMSSVGGRRMGSGLGKSEARNPKSEIRNKFKAQILKPNARGFSHFRVFAF
jgi:hypothetical protein